MSGSRYLCFICQEELSPTVIPVTAVVTCGHVVHTECMHQWFAKGRQECPVCRTSISLVDKRRGLVEKLFFHVDEESMSEGSAQATAAQLMAVQAELDVSKQTIIALRASVVTGHEAQVDLRDRLERERREAAGARAQTMQSVDTIRVLKQENRTLRQEAREAATMKERVTQLENKLRTYKHCEEAIKAESETIDHLIQTSRGPVGIEDIASQYRVQYRSYKQCMQSRQKLKDRVRTLEREQATHSANVAKIQQEKYQSGARENELKNENVLLKNQLAQAKRQNKLNRTMSAADTSLMQTTISLDSTMTLGNVIPSSSGQAACSSSAATGGAKRKIRAPQLSTTINVSSSDEENNPSPLFKKRSRFTRVPSKNSASSSRTMTGSALRVHSGFDGLGGHCLEYASSCSTRTATGHSKKAVGGKVTPGVAAATAARRGSSGLADATNLPTAQNRDRRAAPHPHMPKLPSMDNLIELDDSDQ